MEEGWWHVCALSNEGSRGVQWEIQVLLLRQSVSALPLPPRISLSARNEENSLQMSVFGEVFLLLGFSDDF